MTVAEAEAGEAGEALLRSPTTPYSQETTWRRGLAQITRGCCSHILLSHRHWTHLGPAAESMQN